jgi:hypothetical protein
MWRFLDAHFQLVIRCYKQYSRWLYRVSQKMYTHLNNWYLRTLPLWDQNVKFFTWCDVHWQETANHVDTGATLRTLKSVKESGNGSLDVRGKQYNFEVVLEILRMCAKPKGSVAREVSTEPPTWITIGHIRNEIWGRRYGVRCAETTIWEALQTHQYCVFFCGVAAIHTMGSPPSPPKKTVRRMCWRPLHILVDIRHLSVEVRSA